LMLAVPELRRRMMDQFADLIAVCAELIARRIGRRPDDFEVRTFAGALIGALLAAFFTSFNDLRVDFMAVIDKSLAYLEAGMPLSTSQRT